MLRALALSFIVFSSTLMHAQISDAGSGQSTSVKTPWFVDPASLPLANLIATPPAPGSAAAKSDLDDVHRVERTRTPSEVRAAQYDDTHEDIFLFDSVLGSEFNSGRLPLTAALSAHLRNDAGIVDNPLKQRFGRPRPYNLDATLHPVCETNKEASYPSGHSMNGYLYAFTLAEMVPEQHDAILRRADQYAYNRVVCGSHYLTDTQASRQLASFLFGYLLSNSHFLQELGAATSETRMALRLPPVSK